MTGRSFGAAGGLAFLEPRFSRFAHEIVRLGSGVYLRFGEGVAAVTVDGAATLVEEFRRFFAGETRLIIAFRHPSVTDAPLLGNLFARRVPRLARRAGTPLGARSFVHFLYGRGVPVWAGRPVGWILPRLCAVPVYHRRADSRGMNAVRAAAAAGRFPLALAPEGQVTYHNDTFGELEGGTGRIALWCRDDLHKAGCTEPVRLLPLSVAYHYPDTAADILPKVLREVAAAVGLESDLEIDAHGALDRTATYHYLMTLTAHLVAQLEGLYAPFLPAGTTTGGSEDPGALRARIQAVCDAALRAGELVHHLPSSGSFLDRIFRLRDAGWRAMFRDDIERLSPLERAHADTRAEEAKVATRHMELVDVLEYVDPGSIGPEAPMHRFIEHAVDLHDVINRMRGGTIANRLRVKGRHAVVTAGRAASLDELVRGASPAASRQEGVDRITGYIRSEFERLIAQPTPGWPAPGSSRRRSTRRA
ncbi:MAG: hypothetical protein ACOCYC_04060 [bacterium]